MHRLIVSVIILAISTAAVAEPHAAASNYAHRQTLVRDVCILGGGASGTYAAVRLRDAGKSVALVEQAAQLGGHTQTYIDPYTGVPLDVGVKVFHDTDLVRNYFGRFGVEFVADPQPAAKEQYVDFETGRSTAATYNATIAAGALDAWTAQLNRFPYLAAAGFGGLPNPLPDDLLLPFGRFVDKYGLHDSARAIVAMSHRYTIFQFFQTSGGLFSQPTLYVLKVVGPAMVKSMRDGFVTSKAHNNSLLYGRALRWLNSDTSGGDRLPTVLLNSTIDMVQQNGDGDHPITVWVSDPGSDTVTRINARKLLVALPPTVDMLRKFTDLSAADRELFGMLSDSAALTAGMIYCDSTKGMAYGALSDSTSWKNVGASTSAYGTPSSFPALYTIDPHPYLPHHWTFSYGSPTGKDETDADVQGRVLDAVRRVAGIAASTKKGRSQKRALGPSIVFMSQHKAYGMQVPFAGGLNARTTTAGDIRLQARTVADTFVKLGAAATGQGGQNTIWTGAAVAGQHDTSEIMKAVEASVGVVVAQLDGYGLGGKCGSTGTLC